MSRIPLRSIDHAPAEAQPRLDAARKLNGFLPNLLRLLANAPAALEAYQTVSTINGSASLTLDEREVVQITAAVTHGCSFCVAGHTAIATSRTDLGETAISALRDGKELADERLNALARFTEAVIASRGAVGEAERAAHRGCGPAA